MSVNGSATPAAGERADPGERGREHREVVDADGVRWRVYELASLSAPGSGAGRYLVFDSEAIVRRTSTYPAAWRDLAPADLLALSRRR